MRHPIDVATQLHSCPQRVALLRDSRTQPRREPSPGGECMSIASIASSTLMHHVGQYAQGVRTKWQQGLQQLGQDLQAGNMSAAQSDFTALQQLTSRSSSTASNQSGSSVAQDVTQLGKDLQAGDTSAAQQDYVHLQQDVSATAGGARIHHHHHHSASSSDSGAFSQLLQQLGQALQSGNLTAAQQAYTSLQQQLQLLGQSSTQSSQTGSVAVSA